MQNNSDHLAGGAGGIVQTPQQRANTLEALNVMWPSVPAENVSPGLSDWRSDDWGQPPSCGTVACFGGWSACWPNFQEQGADGWDWDATEVLFKPLSDNANSLFTPRYGHVADRGFKGTDHELVTNRLQWLLDNSTVAA